MKALILTGGGDMPAGLLQAELAKADFVVCADSGARALASAGRKPDLLVGDMDSISAAILRDYEESGVEIVRAEVAKDETDGQLALDIAIARGAAEIVLLGALGGRIDHTVGNMMLLVRAASRGVNAVIRDETCEVFAATGTITIHGKPGGTVSLLPAGSAVAVRYLDGMRFGTREPLPLPVDAPVGVSNEFTADEAHVEIIGWAYVIRIFGQSPQ